MSDKDEGEHHMLAVRVPMALVRQLDARAKYLKGKVGYNVTRSDVARALIKAGLMKKDRKR